LFVAFITIKRTILPNLFAFFKKKKSKQKIPHSIRIRKASIGGHSISNIGPKSCLLYQILNIFFCNFDSKKYKTMYSDPVKAGKQEGSSTGMNECCTQTADDRAAAIIHLGPLVTNAGQWPVRHVSVLYWACIAELRPRQTAQQSATARRLQLAPLHPILRSVSPCVRPWLNYRASDGWPVEKRERPLEIDQCIAGPWLGNDGRVTAGGTGRVP